MARSPRTDARRGLPALALLAPLVLPLLLSSPKAGAEAGGTDPALRFARHGEPLAQHDLAWMRVAAPPSEVRVHEPYERRESVYHALSFARVLDAVYGESWREEEELLFTCSDGYQPTVPVARVLAHGPWLAFARADQPDFSIRKRESGETKTVSLAPFYLVWENLDDAKLRQEADYGWPYQLVGVDLIRTRDRFPKMMPPGGASAEVTAGFAAFRIHCAKCHKVNGEGGSIGPELNAPTSPVEYRDPAWLRTWIEEPSRIAPNARMPALNPELPDRDATVDRILAYLGAMAGAKNAAPDQKPSP